MRSRVRAGVWLASVRTGLVLMITGLTFTGSGWGLAGPAPVLGGPGLVVPGLGAVPAWAHDDDATLVSRLTEVRPALPPPVLVQVRGEQLLVANPTDTPLTILDPDGAEFLRVSSAGVFGNLTAPYLHATANPPELPPRIPPQARPGAEPRWAPLSQGDTWSWFERRLYPPIPEISDLPGRQPTGQSGPEPRMLASWQVGLRYGDQPVTVSGVLERRPVTGTFHVTVDPPDPGDDQLSAQIGQGTLPAVQLQVPPGRTVMVGGLDGVPFLRLAAGGVAANPASVHFRDNPQFRDLPVGPDGWVQVAAAPPVTWLDSRLRYSADRPPDDVATGHRMVEVGRWSIPLTIDGEPRTLTGSIEWVPAMTVESTEPASGIRWVTVGLGAAALLAVLILITLLYLRSTRAR